MNDTSKITVCLQCHRAWEGTEFAFKCGGNLCHFEVRAKARKTLANEQKD
jgi:ribosomal protein L31